MNPCLQKESQIVSQSDGPKACQLLKSAKSESLQRSQQGHHEGNLLVYRSDSFTHQLLLGKRVADTKCYPGATVLLWKLPKIQKGFLKCLSGHCYHPKRREVKLNSFLIFYTTGCNIKSLFTPTSHYDTVLTKVILQCSACHNNTAKWYFYLYWGGKAFQ